MAKKHQKKFRKREPKEFEEEVIQIDRVTRVVKGGRRLRFRATVVIGDKKGRVGYGIGKSSEVPLAIQKAVSRAKKRLIKVPIYKGTIPHTSQVKFKASKILIKPASEGTGIIAGGATRKMLDVAGIRNVLSKSLGSSNRLNNTKATYLALTKLRPRPDMETDEVVAANTTDVDRATPKIKTITKKQAKDMKNADKKGPAKKKPTPKKEAAKKKPAAKKETPKKSE